MNEKQVLLGSLSQDLYRVAHCIQTGSTRSAERFWQESARWIQDLKQHDNPSYLDEIFSSLEEISFDPQSIEQGERILTYGVITQSLAVHGNF